MKVLLLDLTHGADALALEYLEKGNEVTAVDIYHTAPPELKKTLRSKGVRVVDASPAEDFDLLVAPIHCPDKYIGEARFETRLTHHEAVGRLAKFEIPVIEVTGTVAKTTTVHLLGNLLQNSHRRILVLSSRGTFLIDKEGTTAIEPRSSIAPASVLRMSKLRRGQDIAILEVSLGGTGVADIGIITSLRDDYPIAQGTRTAFDGKKQMLTLMKGKAVLPEQDRARWERYLRAGTEKITFGRKGDVSLLLPERMSLGEPLHAAFRTSECLYGFSVPGDWLAAAYSTAMEASFAATLAMGLDPDLAMEALETFHGVPGRGEVIQREGGWTIKERNPGVGASSIDWIVDVLEKAYGIKDMGVVVDPVSVKVCEKLDISKVSKVLSSHVSVKGAYMWETAPEHRKGFDLIASQREAESKHPVLVWCTKEGYV